MRKLFTWLGVSGVAKRSLFVRAVRHVEVPGTVNLEGEAMITEGGQAAGWRRLGVFAKRFRRADL